MERGSFISAAVRRLLCASLGLLVSAAAMADESDSPTAPNDQPPTDSRTTPTITKKPELVTFVEANYPQDARENRVSGSVTFALTINPDGRPSDIQQVSSEVRLGDVLLSTSEAAPYGLEQAALEAVERFVFSPAEVDGEPAPVRIQYRYVFTLTEVVETISEPDDVSQTGRLVGRLVVKGFRQPARGVEVALSSGVSTFTDADGRFVFDTVPVGKIIVTMRDDGYTDFESEEEVRAGEETEVTYYIDRAGFDDSVVVVGRRVKKEVVRRAVTVEEIRLIPGTNGDALAVIQNLPGAARTPLGNSDLILRGGGRTQAYLNTQPIPLPFHFGGLRSTVSSALIEDIQVFGSNFGVEYGRVNGGIVDISLRRPRSDALHGLVEADVFDAGALIEGPVGDNGALAVAVRRSYIDGVLAVALPEDGAVSITAAPRYYDAQILYDYRANGHRLRTLLYGSSDRFVALLTEAAADNPAARGEGALALEWAGGQVDWRYDISGTAFNRINLSYLITSTEASFGRTVDLDFLFHQMLVRQSFEWKPVETFTLRTGLESELLFAKIDAYGSGGPPKEGEPQNAAGFQDAISVDTDGVLFSPALWTEVIWKLGPVLIVPGLRLDYFDATDEFALQPRGTVRYTVTQGTDLKVGLGLYSQVPEGDESQEKIGNPNILSERGWHGSLGLDQKLTDDLELELSAFYKGFDQLIRRVSDPEIRFDNAGIGRAYGLELLLRHSLSARFFGWVSYTLSRSERRDAPGEDWRLFDTDQTHNLILVGQYKITPRWTLGLRWRFVTGNPTTPVVGSVYDADADRYAPLYGATNSERNDDFHQLDLRVDRLWIFNTWRLTAYLDIRNVYNRANGAGLTYNYDFSQSEPRTEIPVVPSFGIRGEF